MIVEIKSYWYIKLKIHNNAAKKFYRVNSEGGILDCKNIYDNVFLVVTNFNLNLEKSFCVDFNVVRHENTAIFYHANELQ